MKLYLKMSYNKHYQLKLNTCFCVAQEEHPILPFMFQSFLVCTFNTSIAATHLQISSWSLSVDTTFCCLRDKGLLTVHIWKVYIYMFIHSWTLSKHLTVSHVQISADDKTILLRSSCILSLTMLRAWETEKWSKLSLYAA